MDHANEPTSNRNFERFLYPFRVYFLTAMLVFKRKALARWLLAQGLSDAALCQAVREMERGLVDADLGGGLFKKRLAREGFGKRSGYRVLVAARWGSRYVWLHAYAKNERSDVRPDELKALRFAAGLFLGFGESELQAAVAAGVLVEVRCEQHH